jgi:PRTRC genetic system protein E
MNFFTQLSSYGQGIDVKLHIKEKGGLVTISVEPQGANTSKLKPLVLTGTPSELDEGFFSQFDGAFQVLKGLTSNLDEVKKAAEAAAKEASEKPQQKSSAAQAKKKAAPEKKDKATKKPTEKSSKKAKPEPAVGDMFSAGAASPSETSPAENSENEVDEPDDELSAETEDVESEAETEEGSSDDQ